MSVSINSPEFAAAWRIVSEALLSHLQSGAPININIKDRGTGAAFEPSEEGCNPEPIKPQPAVRAKQVEDIRYAACPVRQADGSYTLKNLKEDRQSESTFKITRFSDGTCEFELCDLQGEARQIFKDNQADRMPSAVGTASGEITADNKIVNVRPGKGVVDGRSVKIIEPLVVEFK